MSEQSLLVDTDDRGIARLTLNRPEVRNALDDELIHGLTEEFHRLDRDPAVVAIVVTGAGDHFSAGADLKSVRRMAVSSLQENIDYVAELAEMLKVYANLGKPTLSMVRGATVGSGFGLVAASDLAVAAEDSYFALPEVKIGIIPGVISPYILAAIGQRRGRRYFITGERFSAAEAHRIGLVHQVVPAGQLEEAAAQMIGHFHDYTGRN
ncbi:MAG: enoyl-CoA hydratase-related protein [Rhodospirillales bacterium]|nr:enoyl-CoA hydratase-related protein [Rhodospirillales bacterium]